MDDIKKYEILAQAIKDNSATKEGKDFLDGILREMAPPSTSEISGANTCSITLDYKMREILQIPQNSPENKNQMTITNILTELDKLNTVMTQELSKKLSSLGKKETLKLGRESASGYPKDKLNKICDSLRKLAQNIDETQQQFIKFIKENKMNFKSIGISVTNADTNTNALKFGAGFSTMNFTAGLSQNRFHDLEMKIDGINSELSKIGLERLSVDVDFGKTLKTKLPEFLKSKEFHNLLRTNQTFQKFQQCCPSLIKLAGSGLTSGMTYRCRSSDNPEEPKIESIFTDVFKIGGFQYQVRGTEQLSDAGSIADTALLKKVYETGAVYVKQTNQPDDEWSPVGGTP